MKLLIIDDITDEKFSYDVDILRAKLEGWKVRNLRPEVSPSVAIGQIQNEIDTFKPDVTVGIGVSGLLLHQFRQTYRLLIHPSFDVGKDKRIARQEESIREEYDGIAASTFEDMPSDEWKYIYGIFYRNSNEIGPEENQFKQRYKYNYYIKEGYTWAENHENLFANIVRDIYRTRHNIKRKIVYIDMDNVLVDFAGFTKELTIQNSEEYRKYKDHLDDIPDLFSRLSPKEGAVEAFFELSRRFDVYILSTAPWDNSQAWHDKVEWIKRHLGTLAYKRLILSHHKDLCQGDFLIDDSPRNGAEDFRGEWIQFGKKGFENWDKVLDYLDGK